MDGDKMSPNVNVEIHGAQVMGGKSKNILSLRICEPLLMLQPTIVHRSPQRQYSFYVK